MNSNKASTSNILKFFKPNKRAVFFVLLAVLVLGFSVKNSMAVTTYTDNQKSILETTYKLSTDQIKDLQNKNVSYNDFEKKVTALQSPGSLYTAASAATSVYNESVSSGDTLANAVNNPTGLGEIEKAVGAGLMQIVLSVVIAVLAVIAFFCKYLLMFAGWTLDATLNPALYNFTNNQMVVGGWIIVRDVCNLFFLLVLLFIAICTILKIEKYHAKKTLLMLIIMALLINFSKPIAIFIFDGFQLLMNFFLSQITTTGGQNVPSTKLAADIAEFMYGSLKSQLEGSSTSPELAVYYLFIVVFLFMFAIALFVTAIFLIIRIIAVMLLIILSPLAFFAAIVPDLNKMSSSWWNALFKYCYYGPAAAFFLFLAVKFSLATGNVLPKLNVTGGNAVIQHIIIYLTVLVFLYASIIMSQQFGIFAANAVVGNANKFMKWGAGMTKTGGVWGAAGRTTGITGGVSQRLQQSGLTRWMTKEGRKRNQKAMEARVAGALGVTGARTKRLKEAADDLKNESNANIQRMAAGGDMVAAYVASNRGILNDNIVNAIQPQLARDADTRNEFVRNARKNGQAHQALNIRLQTAGLEEGAMHNNPAAIATNEINRVATSDLVKNQNINDLAQMPHALVALIAAFDELNNRLTVGTPAQREAAQEQLNHIISEASAQNLAALSANRPTAPGGPRPIMA